MYPNIITIYTVEMESNVIILQKTTVLQKTANITTQNCIPYYTKLHDTIDKLPAHATDTN